MVGVMNVDSTLQAEALQNLAKLPPREFVARQASGKRQLHHLHQLCCTSGLSSTSSAADDVARLYALFDLSLYDGLSSVIVDYVVEVCSDETLTSSDLLEAFLLDGECVSRWCTTAVRDLRQRLEHLLQEGLHSLPVGSGLRRIGASLSALIAVIRALDPGGRDQSRRTSGPDLHEVIRLQQCTKVVEWVRQHKMYSISRSGRFSSREEWQLAVKMRRDAAQPRTTFLQDILNDLREKHGSQERLSYPPEDLGQALGNLFLQGSVSEEAWKLKLAALLYYLLDVGNKAAFGIPQDRVAQLQAQFLLDEAGLQQPGNLPLETACSILPECASSALPFKVVEVLASRGKPHVALQILRACSRAAHDHTKSALHETQTAVRILLECNLVTEAYFEVRQHCRGVSGDRQAQDTAALIHCMADWAAAASALHRVIELPLLGGEEEALREWLEKQIQISSPNGDFLVLFYLQRQRITEALQANSRLSPVPGALSERRAHLKLLLASAAQLLPEAQANLHSSKVAAPHVIGSAGTRPSPFGSLTRQHVNVAAPKVLQRIVAAPEQPGASSLAKPPASSLHLMQTNAFPREERNKDTVTRDFSEPSGFGRAAAALEQASAEVGQLEDDWDTLMGVETGGKAGSKRRRQPQSRARRR